MASSLNISLQEFERLKGLEKEYKITVSLVAILVEQLLKQTDGTRVMISDEAISNPPEYRAWRDEAKDSVVFEIRRR